MKVTNPLNEIEWQTGVLISPTVMLRKQWENMPFKTPFYINVIHDLRNYGGQALRCLRGMLLKSWGLKNTNVNNIVGDEP